MRALTVLALSLLAFNANASKEPEEQPYCAIKGKVINVKKRIEMGTGLSEGKKLQYIDVLVRVKDIVGKEKDACGNMLGSEHIYQMRGGFLKMRHAPKPNTCIGASTHIMADSNFLSGNWLSDIEKLPIETCEKVLPAGTKTRKR